MRTCGAAVRIPPEYQHATSPVVKVRVLYRADYDPAEYYRRLVTFAKYLVKDGKGGETSADYFGPGAVDVQTFLAQAWQSPHNFQLIVSPDPEQSRRLDLQEYAEVWMQQLQTDLGIRLNWIGSIHRDTDEPHFQALLVGTSLTGEPFRIARPYISEGMRARAAEMQDLYGGTLR